VGTRERWLHVPPDPSLLSISATLHIKQTCLT
jgi:hypothetical protein